MTAPMFTVPSGDEYRALCARILATLDRDSLRARGRCVVGAFVKVGTFRGERRVLAGYQWSRPQSHFMSGRVYECTLGRGFTAETAVARVERAK